MSEPPHRFAAMGCDVVVGGAGPAERARIETLFAEREAVFSRFRPESELTRVNRSRSPFVVVSETFAEAVDRALWAAVETGGLVDPTLGAAIEAAGYTDDFDRLRPDAEPPGEPRPGCPGRVWLAGRVLARPPGVLLDLNGVVKSMAVDAALELLPGPGFVSAGGDLATRGPLEVELPGGGSVRLERGALATSGSGKRRWERGGAAQHHLLDPRTGRPADSPWEQVTVCGATCLVADVAAKAAFLLGADGPAWLDARELPGRFVTAAGEVSANARWGEQVEPGVGACT